jgi:hypothetical protein
MTIRYVHLQAKRAQKLFVRLAEVEPAKAARATAPMQVTDTRTGAQEATRTGIYGDLTVRKWWNWQTHHLEGVAPKGVGVQIPPSAPFLII